MRIKLNTPTDVLGLLYDSNDDISLALVCASRAEAVQLQAEARRLNRRARIVPLTITLSERSDPNTRPGDQL